jgi:predicted nuclease of predicted toxin-antitoxin system
MKFKLDENLGVRTAALIRASGHDVETISQEKLNGISDERLFEICIAERRCLVTLDLDFADVLRFPPHETAGIAILRLPQRASPDLLRSYVRNLLAALEREPITGKLWVVESTRIRLYKREERPEERDPSAAGSSF